MQGKVLIADSWFGSVACALALFKFGLYCVMNVKTAHKNYPKDAMLEIVGEIKGNTAEAKAARKVRRGKQVAFTRDFMVGSRSVTLTAGGHNKKVPLLLISTYSSMLPGEAHTKTWTSHTADGGTQYNTINCDQTLVHAVYRKWMNIVDLHNKLRQGVVSMADVWMTISWHERHFAEGIGLWEVNVFKALLYFLPRDWGGLPHSEFRQRLAWAFMTLGKVPYPKPSASKPRPADAAPTASKHASGTPTPSSSSASPPNAKTGAPEGANHFYVKYSKAGQGRTCGHCGNLAFQNCMLCEQRGFGHFPVCGLKSKRKGECMATHASGAARLFGSWAAPRCRGKKGKQSSKKRAAPELNSDSELADSEMGEEDASDGSYSS